MPTWQRTYLAACAAVIGYCLAYTASDYGRWPRLTYYPYEREWQFVSNPANPIPMQYLGTLLWGLGGALLAAALVWLATLAVRREASARVLHLAGGWALIGFVYAGAYFTWNLWPF